MSFDASKHVDGAVWITPVDDACRQIARVPRLRLWTVSSRPSYVGLVRMVVFATTADPVDVDVVCSPTVSVL
jgi:hypothetical protein